MGMVNEFHGPQEFLGAQRPLAETLIIPTTWNAVGFGIVGHWRIADYRAFVVNGFNAAGFSVFGSRDARDISVDTIKTPAITFRLDGHLFKGGMLGISGFRGKSEAFGTPIPTNSKFPTFLKEAHFEFSRAGWLARAEYAKLDVDKTEKLNPALGTSGFLGVGSRMVGGYLEAGYDFWSRRNSGKRLMPYWRWEVVNPQDALPRSDIALGLLKNLEVDHTVFTYGMEFWPINGLQLKVDYQFDHAERVDLGVNHFNIAMAYVF